ncbi:MAG: biopolymer transporter ExbD [Pirellulales bacterium]|nr:biopolymer transporter ExbD [Pirellulales bacterium]
MKIRHSIETGQVKADTQMTPMIDVVFLLLIFFLVTFKIPSREGDFDITMPPPESSGPPESTAPSLIVKMTAGPNGELADLIYKDTFVSGNSDAERFDNLQLMIAKDLEIIGPETAEAPEVEIDYDFGLQYGYVMTAISHINGRYVNNQLVDMVEKIRFTRHPEDRN